MEDPFERLKRMRDEMAQKRETLRGQFGLMEYALRSLVEKYSGTDPFGGEPYLALEHGKRPEDEHVVTLRCCGEWWLEIGISDRLPDEERVYRGLYVSTNLRDGYNKHFDERVKNIRGLKNVGETVEFTWWNGQRRDNDTMDVFPLKVDALVHEFLMAAGAQAFFENRAYNPQ